MVRVMSSANGARKRRNKLQNKPTYRQSSVLPMQHQRRRRHVQCARWVCWRTAERNRTGLKSRSDGPSLSPHQWYWTVGGETVSRRRMAVVRGAVDCTRTYPVGPRRDREVHFAKTHNDRLNGYRLPGYWCATIERVFRYERGRRELTLPVNYIRSFLAYDTISNYYSGRMLCVLTW